MKKNNTNRGSITPALMVIAGAFIIALYGLLFVLQMQVDFAHRQVAFDKALHIAEAGVNYYYWHLTQSPNDYRDGTGQPGPFLHDYSDSDGTVMGQYSLQVEPPTPSTQIVTITSTGWTNQFPNIKRTVKVQYGHTSLTSFAFMHNSNLWFGNDVTINGPVFSNGGIRQDGTNTSTVSSAKQTYICGLDTGCTTPEQKAGVWGSGKTKQLWEFPVNPLDFESIKVNFSNMRTIAQTTELYLEPSEAQGYRLVFSADGNVTVYKVTGADSIKGYSPENGCENLYQIITSQTEIGIYPLEDINLIFAEDNIWVEGTVNGRVTVVAAKFPLGSYISNIWINNNIRYLEKNGQHKLGLIAQKNIIIGRDVPEYFDIQGAYLAQNGRIIRHHYNYFQCSHSSDKMKNELNFYGSLISDKRSYWNFSGGAQSPASGFVKTTLDYDATMYYDPPPYFPAWGVFEFISWSEIK